jgi:tRNA-Thr(GGU) m(6)t(6)A37 methyltransferase TsaA
MNQQIRSEMALEPIGVVRSPRTDVGYSDGWGGVVARVELRPELGTESLTGLADFSHVDVVYWFDQVRRRPSYAGLSHPRGRADLPMIGVFAARGPNRPNPIGVSACAIVAVGDTWVEVRGLDAVDNTPVLDLKPLMPRLLPTRVTEPAWSAELMARYYQD